MGKTLCDSCFSIFRQQGTFIRSVRTSEGWTRDSTACLQWHLRIVACEGAIEFNRTFAGKCPWGHVRTDVEGEVGVKRRVGSDPKVVGERGGREKHYHWSGEEHARFMQGLGLFGTIDAQERAGPGRVSVGLGPWVAEQIALRVPSRTVSQVRSHAQKYFLGLGQQEDVEHAGGTEEAEEDEEATAASSSSFAPPRCPPSPPQDAPRHPKRRPKVSFTKPSKPHKAPRRVSHLGIVAMPPAEAVVFGAKAHDRALPGERQLGEIARLRIENQDPKP